MFIIDYQFSKVKGGLTLAELVEGSSARKRPLNSTALVASYTCERAAAMFLGSKAKEFYNKQNGKYGTVLNKTASFESRVDYFRRFYQYFEENGSEFSLSSLVTKKVQFHCVNTNCLPIPG